MFILKVIFIGLMNIVALTFLDVNNDSYNLLSFLIIILRKNNYLDKIKLRVILLVDSQRSFETELCLSDVATLSVRLY
jgi:hypothetical protein